MPREATTGLDRLGDEQSKGLIDKQEKSGPGLLPGPIDFWINELLLPGAPTGLPEYLPVADKCQQELH